MDIKNLSRVSDSLYSEEGQKRAKARSERRDSMFKARLRRKLMDTESTEDAVDVAKEALKDQEPEVVLEAVVETLGDVVENLDETADSLRRRVELSHRVRDRYAPARSRVSPLRRRHSLLSHHSRLADRDDSGYLYGSYDEYRKSIRDKWYNRFLKDKDKKPVLDKEHSYAEIKALKRRLKHKLMDTESTVELIDEAKEALDTMPPADVVETVIDVLDGVIDNISEEPKVVESNKPVGTDDLLENDEGNKKE